MKTDKIITNKLSTLEVLNALISEHQWLDLIAEKNSKHKALIQHIHQIADDEEYCKISIKKISEQINEKPAIVTQAIHKLYDDIWSLNEEQPELFKKQGFRHELSFSDDYHVGPKIFTLWLEYPLRKGEYFYWPFIRAKFSREIFYIDGVYHSHEQGRQKLSVYLGREDSNTYRKMLYDKAEMLGLISLDELFSLRGYKLDDLLIHRVEKKLGGYPESLSYLNSKKRS